MAPSMNSENEIVRFYAGKRTEQFTIEKNGARLYFFNGLKHPFEARRTGNGNLVIERRREDGVPYFYRRFMVGV